MEAKNYQIKQIREKKEISREITEEKIKQKFNLMENDRKFKELENKKNKNYQEKLNFNKICLENQINQKKMEEFMSNEERKINKSLLEKIKN